MNTVSSTAQVIKKTKILLVDDDIRVLNGYHRVLGKYFEIKLANDPVVGLKILKKENDIAVIISDFMMPKVDGNLFFEIAKDISPNSIRIMLSGNADLSTAVDAINKSSVYKLLIKPFPATELKDIIFEAIKVYNKKVKSKDIEDDTLLVVSEILKDLILMINPRDGHFMNTIVDTVKVIVKLIKFNNHKKIMIAASLSQLGFINMPAHIKINVYNKKKLSSDEIMAMEEHPKFAKQLILKRPSLVDIANGIASQNKDFIRASSIKDKLTSDIARILRASIDFSINLIYYDSYKRAIRELEKNHFIYDPDIIKALKIYVNEINEDYKVIEVSPLDVKEGMIVARDFFNSSNELLVIKGSVISSSLKLKLMTACHFNMCKNKMVVKFIDSK